jgi:hypothetical protein
MTQINYNYTVNYDAATRSATLDITASGPTFNILENAVPLSYGDNVISAVGTDSNKVNFIFYFTKEMNICGARIEFDKTLTFPNGITVTETITESLNWNDLGERTLDVDELPELRVSGNIVLKSGEGITMVSDSLPVYTEGSLFVTKKDTSETIIRLDHPVWDNNIFQYHIGDGIYESRQPNTTLDTESILTPTFLTLKPKTTIPEGITSNDLSIKVAQDLQGNVGMLLLQNNSTYDMDVNVNIFGTIFTFQKIP